LDKRNHIHGSGGKALNYVTLVASYLNYEHDYHYRKPSPTERSLSVRILEFLGNIVDLWHIQALNSAELKSKQLNQFSSVIQIIELQAFKHQKEYFQSTASIFKHFFRNCIENAYGCMEDLTAFFRFL